MSQLALIFIGCFVGVVAVVIWMWVYDQDKFDNT
jgi:hypothetical protein